MRGLAMPPPAMSNSLSSGTGFAELAIGAIAGTDLSSEVVVEDFPKLNLGILNILVLGSPVESLAEEDEDDFKWNFAKSFSSVNVCGFSATDGGVVVAESYLSVSGSKAGNDSGHERDEETFH